ncbi:MAG TPA: UbiA family prenyltransferase [Candidatus Eisenbacteria bacterium]|nr:UbiA family prenyltransferase [Candidatus Eisenbacteria bacterium]
MRGAPGARGAAARSLDLLAALRPQLWIPAILLFESGRTVAGRGSLAWPGHGSGPWAALLSLLAILGAVHVGNAWRDRISDRRNRKAGPIADGTVSGRAAAWLAAACLAAAAAAASRPEVGGASRLLLLAAALLGALYVVPPFEAKRRAWLDLAAQAAGYGLVAFLLGASTAIAIAPRLLLDAAPYAAGIASVSLLTMIADREGDRAAGQETTAVRIGSAAAERLALGFACLAAALGLARSDAVPGLWGAAAAAWIGLGPPEGASGDAAARPSESRIRDAVALQILLASLLATRTPIPFLATAAIGLLVALDSRRRRGTLYPLGFFTGGAAGSDAGAATARDASR